MATISETLAAAVQCHRAGHLQAAEDLYRQVVAVDPSQANAWHLLGVINVQRGQRDSGVEYIRRALSLEPGWAEAHFNLGWALKEQGKPEEAQACFRWATELKPDYVEAHDTLGSVLLEQGKLEEAEACHRRALELNPDYAVAHNRLGLALAAQGKLDEAAACYQRAAQLKPDFIEAHNNLGNVYANQGKPVEAVDAYCKALEIMPDFAEGHKNVGNVYEGQGKLTQAVDCYRRALELKPDFAEGYVNLGNAWLAQGKLEDAVSCYRRGLELKPDYPAAHSTLLGTLQYRSSVTLRELAEAHGEYERRYAAPLRSAWPRHENIRDPERRLRVGFLSRDLHRHPVGYFLIRMFENIDQDRIETVCYYDAPEKDDVANRFQAAAAVWLDVFGWTDQRLAERIRSDRIDILFDLSGHTGGNRLLMFARKPAPIQITWAGYVGTTGLAAMDYILADRYEIPPQHDGYYCERVLRMPDGYICYDPPDYAPPVSPLPAIEKGYVTFAAFHNPAKITPQVVEVWAQILARLPEARLVLKFRGMDDPSVAERLTELFAAQAVDLARVEILGFSEHGEALAEYGRIDVALDTFPYNGGLTTCEALWMGVPVVTCPGETFASRHSLSHLSNVGLTETIAADLRQYVEIAVALAAGTTRGVVVPWLAALRSRLREQMAASPLCDGKRFAANFADVLRGAWRDWCEEDSGFRVQDSDSHSHSQSES